ncbi:hypothetical protein BT63DRAFT_32941 [Microthyrium microscopicum]|uniref:Uncharacterized protein n=1 Tax=Microthyrium microscopicum TaxID=703497 RepID=A0A6A6UUV8_9PEZI|nr:hypothetical protein BT63DRAFT_32941 [Microthyrium microscopicum]
MSTGNGTVVNHETQKPSAVASVTLESWSQGFMVGAMVVMAGITIANMRRGVLLHKLILLELIMGMPHGTFMFPNPPAYGWYLSVTAIFLNMSWSLHNVIAWIKNKPFLSRKVSLIYIGTVILAQPYWVLEIYANFTFFNNINNLFESTRPYEAIFRDPWWIFTVVNLFWNIKRRYEFGLVELIKVSPRFGVLLFSMFLSICFIILDCLSVTSIISHALPDGLNPFWKLAFVFKCLTDTIILDDFKTALDKLKAYKLGQFVGGSTSAISELDRNTRRPTEYAPWNESRGITRDERIREKRSPIIPEVDLESQLERWPGQEETVSNGSHSTATK